jgi:general secretion pathway protein A
MYEQFYGVRERPFELTSNLKFLVMTTKHREALSTLEYGVAAGNGITLLVGEAGTGKTTVLRHALASHLRDSVDGQRTWVCLNNPTLTRQEFLETIAHGFQLSADAATSKSRLLRELEDVCRDRRARGSRCGLVIDEAQSVPDDLLEEVRLLANMEFETDALLRVVLVGQPSLAARLNRVEVRQFKQRIGLRCVLPPLDLRETVVYVARRLTRAGGIPQDIFSRDAVLAIYERSGGIPRTINVICENALLTGFAADRRPVDADIVCEVCRDLDLLAFAASRMTVGRTRSVAAR